MNPTDPTGLAPPIGYLIADVSAGIYGPCVPLARTTARSSALFLCLSRLNLHDVNLGVHDAVQKQVGPQILLIRLHNGDQIQHRF